MGWHFLIFPIWGVSFILPMGLLVLLQVWLCRKENRWLGLILPAIFFLLSLILTFAAAVGYFVTQGPTPHLGGPEHHGIFVIGRSLFDFLFLGGRTFIFTNIPTMILGYIWFYHQRRP